MSEIQEIDVYIHTDGTVKVEVRGVKGRKCLDLTKGLEALLGGQVLQRELTPEYEESHEKLAEEDSLRLGTRL